MIKKERGSYLWRYDADSGVQQKINAWMDQQSNVRDSLQMLVLYFVDRFGNVNVMDYDVQKKLYADVLGQEVPPVQAQVLEETERTMKKEKEESDHSPLAPDTGNEENDIFDGVNPKNI
ncbi:MULTISPECIES: hypothetical protein [unclassified Sporolactobacillus]|uniref:hypothetical protein n=1 Tax=unclassified Sporolactobacillus TaxID=2628533 RepID=UPI002367C3BE|nr:hypothetical protein [Sporolactobacillus sp. CQH2019]MDD9150429.1 hypothetical protein [Sporolactobacillus sp. CQH2019]